jgi:hypothetical protein
MKLLQESIRKAFQELGIDNDFLNRIPIAQDCQELTIGITSS